jgi:hypothetical protein
MLHKTRHLAGFDLHLALSSRSRMIAYEKDIAPMSTIQERIQENEHRAILDRQSLAHMENSSWRYMSDLYSALGGGTDPSTQGLSFYEHTIGRLKVEIYEWRKPTSFFVACITMPKAPTGAGAECAGRAERRAGMRKAWTKPTTPAGVALALAAAARGRTT